MMDNFIWLDQTFSINLTLVKAIHVNADNLQLRFTYSDGGLDNIFNCVSQKQFLYLLEHKLEMSDYLMAKYQRMFIESPW